MIRLGLTGSIGTGKSTTAAMFADLGVPVWDADAAVHRLYATGGAAVAPLAVLFPDASAEGAVSRPRLAEIIAADPSALPRIESVVHPLVAADRAAFLADAAAEVTLCDVPLLFETGQDHFYDATLVTTCPPETQRARVLARPGMTEERFQALLARQMPDAEKRARADYVIETKTLGATRARVAEILALVKERFAHA